MMASQSQPDLRSLAASKNSRWKNQTDVIDISVLLYQGLLTFSRMGKASARQAGLKAAVIPYSFLNRDSLGGCTARRVPIIAISI